MKLGINRQIRHNETKQKDIYDPLGVESYGYYHLSEESIKRLTYYLSKINDQGVWTNPHEFIPAVFSINGNLPNLRGNVDFPAVFSVNGNLPDKHGNVDFPAVFSVNKFYPDEKGAVEIPAVFSVNGNIMPDEHGNVEIPMEKPVEIDETFFLLKNEYHDNIIFFSGENMNIDSPANFRNNFQAKIRPLNPIILKVHGGVRGDFEHYNPLEENTYIMEKGCFTFRKLENGMIDVTGTFTDA